MGLAYFLRFVFYISTRILKPTLYRIKIYKIEKLNIKMPKKTVDEEIYSCKPTQNFHTKLGQVLPLSNLLHEILDTKSSYRIFEFYFSVEDACLMVSYTSRGNAIHAMGTPEQISNLKKGLVKKIKEAEI